MANKEMLFFFRNQFALVFLVGGQNKSLGLEPNVAIDSW